MKNIKGIIPSLILCANPSLNIFIAKFNDIEVRLRQPRRGDSGRSRLAWADLSRDRKLRYQRRNMEKQLYNMNYRCKLPLYRGETPGWLPLIMEVDKTIVSFVDIIFKYGDSEFRKYLIRSEEKAMSCSIGVLDKYQGMGFGTAYSYLTDEIGRHFGIDWILGTTYLKSGMYNIRVRDNWEVIRKYGDMVDHRKSLKIEEKPS